jgi:hypothetical protein
VYQLDEERGRYGVGQCHIGIGFGFDIDIGFGFDIGLGF